MKKRILLDFNEKAYNELVKNQETASKAISALVGYCEETLEIKITNLQSFFKNPKSYCMDAYWDKYGSQFGSAPVKKEKAFELTGWNDFETESYWKPARIGLDSIGRHQYEFNGPEITFNADPESFKKYLREEDEELYNLSLEFIEVAKKMEAAGSKPVRNFAQYAEFLMVDGDSLAPSKIYFSTSPEFRSRGLGMYFN